MTTTIRQVAKKCNYSIGTVSNVLNNRGSVTPVIRARVESAIAELGYVPNHSRRTTTGGCPTVSFLLGNRELLDPFHSRILEGVSLRCEDEDALLLFSKLQYGSGVDPGKIRLPVALRTRGLVDCVVLAGVHYPNLLEALGRLNTPYVLLANNFVTNQQREPVDQVRFDDMAAARDATDYLIEMGHRDIWFIGDISFPWFNNRYQGYVAAMHNAGLNARAQTAGISDDRFLNGFRCTASIINANQPVTAIFAGTDEVAYGCWEYLQQTSLRVPDQVSLLGFDDQRGPYKGVGLSTVRVEAESIGSYLAQMAIEKGRVSSAHGLPEIVVPTRLIKRGTCQPVQTAMSTGRKQRSGDLITSGRQLGSAPEP